ncbi:MAG: DUF2391 family protein [Aquificae bacterium]|nr:DUF2391 family protein [Aquificota bacterium]
MKERLSSIDRRIESIEKKVNELFEDHERSKKLQNFQFADFVQELIGALVVALPFSLTEEIWELASKLSMTRVVLIFLFVAFVVYLFIKYSKLQNWKEQNLLGFIPLRLVTSLGISLLVSFFSLVIFGVYPDVLGSGYELVKATLLVSVFAVIGSLGLDMAK